jgi:hypothetical protein
LKPETWKNGSKAHVKANSFTERGNPDHDQTIMQLLDADDWERKAAGKMFTEKQKKDKFDRMKPFKAEKGGEKAKATIRILLYLSMYPQLWIISCLGYKIKLHPIYLYRSHKSCVDRGSRHI